jgi:(2Fe-2S) ferredoxin
VLSFVPATKSESDQWKIHYQWYKDGQRVVGDFATQPTLVVSEASYSDMGDYQCVVSVYRDGATYRAVSHTAIVRDADRVAVGKADVEILLSGDLLTVLIRRGSTTRHGERWVRHGSCDCSVTGVHQPAL